MQNQHIFFCLFCLSGIKCDNYGDNIEYITPSLLAEVETEFNHVNRWSLDLLRSTSIEMESVYNQVMKNTPPGIDCKGQPF